MPQPCTATSDAVDATTMHLVTQHTQALSFGVGGAMMTTIQQMTSFTMAAPKNSFRRPSRLLCDEPSPCSSFSQLCHYFCSAFWCHTPRKTAMAGNHPRDVYQGLSQNSFFFFFFSMAKRNPPHVSNTWSAPLLFFLSSHPLGLAVDRRTVLTRRHLAPCWTHTENLAFLA